MYVSQFHSRARFGIGALYEPTGFENSEQEFSVYTRVVTHPGRVFPTERSNFAVDEELNYHQLCFATDDKDTTPGSPYWDRKCPEMEHTLDDFDNPYEPGRFFPMTPEDIYRVQLAYGIAPTQAIAGFYDPKYVIIGDADMNHFDIADWSKLLIRLERSSKISSCVQSEFRHKGLYKPIYSLLDRTDPDYPINYYRIQYKAKPYATTKAMKKKFADTAIFEAIGLEDRLLLVTNVRTVDFVRPRSTFM